MIYIYNNRYNRIIDIIVKYGYVSDYISVNILHDIIYDFDI